MAPEINCDGLRAHLRNTRGTVEREAAALGVLVGMEGPTKAMVREAADAGFYTSPAGTRYPRLQILTVEQPLNGQKLDLPAWHGVRTFKKAQGEGEEGAGGGVVLARIRHALTDLQLW